MRPNIPKYKEAGKEYYRGRRLSPAERMLLQFRDAEWEAFMDQERADLVRCVMECFLYAAAQRYHLGAAGVKKLYEDAIRDIWESRALFRDYGSGQGYEIQRTGHNAENVYYREELRKMGVDVGAWEDGITIDDEKIKFGQKPTKEEESNGNET